MPNTSLNMLALPSYTLEPAPPLVGFVSDTTLSLVVPLLVYWVTSLFFHWLETSGWLSEYRIHTSEEEKARNTVSRWQCLRRVLLIQVIQLSVGAVLARGSEGDVTGKEDYDVVVWARRLLMLRGYVPYLLSVIGLDVWSFGNKYASYGLGFHGINFSEPMVGEKFGSWEMAVARVLFWYIVPALQYIICVFVIDTWQYFVHRFEHTNKWVYSKSIITCRTIKASTNILREHPLGPPSPLRFLCLWRHVHPSPRGLLSRYIRKHAWPYGRWPLEPTVDLLWRLRIAQSSS